MPSPPPTIVVFEPPDLSAVLAAVDGAAWVNLQPEVDDTAVDEDAGGGFFRVFGASGPTVPFATWHPGERSAGLQHGAGPKLARRLDVPAGWRVVQDHPRRGLVVRVDATATTEDVLRWLLATSTSLCPLPLLGRWVAEVHG